MALPIHLTLTLNFLPSFYLVPKSHFSHIYHTMRRSKLNLLEISLIFHPHNCVLEYYGTRCKKFHKIWKYRPFPESWLVCSCISQFQLLTSPGTTAGEFFDRAKNGCKTTAPGPKIMCEVDLKPHPRGKTKTYALAGTGSYYTNIWQHL